jgi:hypothetical protein
MGQTITAARNPTTEMEERRCLERLTQGIRGMT